MLMASSYIQESRSLQEEVLDTFELRGLCTSPLESRATCDHWQHSSLHPILWIEKHETVAKCIDQFTMTI